MRKIIIPLLSFLVLSCSSGDSGTSEEDIFISIEASEEFPGGETTVFDISGAAFEFNAQNLENSDLIDFFSGNSLFEQNWVTAPASTTVRDGLGPFFNSRACAGCHAFDGRGRVPEFDGETNHGLLLRLKSLEVDENGENLGDPIYGGQLQDRALTGIIPEGSFRIIYEEVEINYPDGNIASLRKPTYEFINLAYGNVKLLMKMIYYR